MIKTWKRENGFTNHCGPSRTSPMEGQPTHGSRLAHHERAAIVLREGPCISNYLFPSISTITLSSFGVNPPAIFEFMFSLVPRTPSIEHACVGSRPVANPIRGRHGDDGGPATGWAEPSRGLRGHIGGNDVRAVWRRQGAAKCGYSRVGPPRRWYSSTMTIMIRSWHVANHMHHDLHMHFNLNLKINLSKIWTKSAHWQSS